MKFNIALLSPIVGTLGALGVWFGVANKTNPLWTLLVALFLQLLGFIIVLGPDKTDSRTDKDFANWRSFVPVLLAIAGIIGLAIYKSHA